MSGAGKGSREDWAWEGVWNCSTFNGESLTDFRCTARAPHSPFIVHDIQNVLEGAVLGWGAAFPEVVCIQAGWIQDAGREAGLGSVRWTRDRALGGGTRMRAVKDTSVRFLLGQSG